MKLASPEILEKLGVTQDEYITLKAHQYVDAVHRLREGDWRPYFKFQWPDLVLDWFQEDMVEHVFSPTIHSVWVKGNTGCGKGAGAGLVTAAFLDAYQLGRVIATASSVQQALDSVHKETILWLSRMMRQNPTLKPLAKSISDEDLKNKGHEMLVLNPETPQSFAGRHAEHNLFVLDEGTEQDEETFDIVMTQAKKVLCMGNPRTMSGFYRKQFGYTSPDETQTIAGDFGPKRLITVDGKYTMNVRMKCLRKAVGPIGGIVVIPDDRDEAIRIMDEEDAGDWKKMAKRAGGKFYEHNETIPREIHETIKPIIPGQNDYGWFVGQMNHQWEFNRRVFGRAKFPLADPEKQVILPSWLERHKDDWTEKSKIKGGIPVTALGLDIGFSEDKPFLAAGGLLGCRGLFTPHHPIKKTEKLKEWIYKVCYRDFDFDLTDGAVPIGVDTDGPGKGLSDILASEGCWVIAIKSGESTSANIDTNRYLNLRASMYGELGNRLNPDLITGKDPFPLPPDVMAMDELCWPEKIPVGHDGLKFKLTDKKTLRKIHGRSPDRGDSIVYMYRAIQEATEIGSVVDQLDTTTVNVDFSWRDSMADDLHQYRTMIATEFEEKEDKSDPMLARRLESLEFLKGFDPDGYKSALSEISLRHPDTVEGKKAKQRLSRFRHKEKKGSR